MSIQAVAPAQHTSPTPPPVKPVAQSTQAAVAKPQTTNAPPAAHKVDIKA